MSLLPWTLILFHRSEYHQIVGQDSEGSLFLVGLKWESLLFSGSTSFCDAPEVNTISACVAI
jgi:hypothetical protein